MQLQRYLTRIYNSIHSRREIRVEHLHIDEPVPSDEGSIEGRLRFWDDSLLEFYEILHRHKVLLVKVRYSYHYQDQHGQLIFRYDNAPHHPKIATFPHHKHVANPSNQTETIEPAIPPHINDVLHEIDRRLYPPN